MRGSEHKDKERSRQGTELFVWLLYLGTVVGFRVGLTEGSTLGLKVGDEVGDTLGLLRKK